MNKTILEKIDYLLDLSNDNSSIKQERTKLWKELGNLVPNEIVEKIKKTRDNKLSKIRYQSQWWNDSIGMNNEYLSLQKKQNSYEFHQLYALNSPILDEKQFKEALSKKDKQGRIILGKLPISDSNYIQIMSRYFDKHRNQMFDRYEVLTSEDLNVVNLMNPHQNKYFVSHSSPTISKLYDYLSKWFENQPSALFINEYNYEFILKKLKDIELFITKTSILGNIRNV